MIERIKLVLPDFEAVVYESIAQTSLGSLVAVEDKDYLYKRIAMGPWCREACKLGRTFLSQHMGLAALRTEVHGTPDWLHHFLSVPTSMQEMQPEDIVVDPTYLQFADNLNVEEMIDTRPNVFVGTRAAIMLLMQDPTFTSEALAPSFYQSTTLTSVE